MKHVRLAIVVGLSLLALLPSAPAAAAHSVDPDTLNPSPYDLTPPGATITCQATGQGTICKGRVAFTFTLPSGLFCDGVELVQVTTVSGDLSDWYDPAGDVTKIINHWSKPAGPGNTITDPATGQAVPWSAQYTLNATFPDPGNFDTWIRSIDGRLDSVALPGSGLILHDAGTVMHGPDGLIKQGGPSDIATAVNGSGVLPALCAALGA